MRRGFLGLTAIIMVAALALSGCNQSAAKAEDLSKYSNENKIPYPSGAVLEGAAMVEREHDVKDSPYYKHMDFYNMNSNDHLTILSRFKTTQQTTWWSAGPCCALMVANWFNRTDGKSELDLGALRGTSEPGATTLGQMVEMFKGLGGFDIYSTYDLEDPEKVPETLLPDSLKAGKPVLVGWDEWGGVWQVVVGYDTMGTADTADDVLIMADPYDTTDHDQDGYVIVSYERFVYNWINTFDKEFSRNLFVVVTPK